MAIYDKVKLRSYAGDLVAFSVISSLARGAKYAAIYFAYHSARVLLLETVEAFTHKLVTYPELHAPDTAYTSIIGFWFVFGAAVGFVSSQKYRIEAQKILCQVEQESHLAEIAKELRVRPWPTLPPPIAPPGAFPSS